MPTSFVADYQIVFMTVCFLVSLSHSIAVKSDDRTSKKESNKTESESESEGVREATRVLGEMMPLSMTRNTEDTLDVKIEPQKLVQKVMSRDSNNKKSSKTSKTSKTNYQNVYGAQCQSCLNFKFPIGVKLLGRAVY